MAHADKLVTRYCPSCGTQHEGIAGTFTCLCLAIWEPGWGWHSYRPWEIELERKLLRGMGGIRYLSS